MRGGRRINQMSQVKYGGGAVGLTSIDGSRPSNRTLTRNRFIGGFRMVSKTEAKRLESAKTAFAMNKQELRSQTCLETAFDMRS